MSYIRPWYTVRRSIRNFITNKNSVTVARISGKIELLSVKLKSKEDCMMPLFFTPSLFDVGVSSKDKINSKQGMMTCR